MKSSAVSASFSGVYPRCRLIFSLSVAGLLPAAATGWGQEAGGGVASPVAGGEVNLAPVTVVGEAINIPRIAGSAAVIDQQQIQRQTYTNPNRVFQQVPGVYVREEDGFGNFPNISLRGADGGRSSKTTILEDGIMMAPAPYSEPAAYYSPRIGRMSGVEVLKGSSQVRYGPHTTGGVINYLATPFVALPDAPLEEETTSSAKNPKAPATPAAASSPLMAEEFFLKSTYGSFNTWMNHAWWGRSQQTEAGDVGLVIEFFHNQSDGFRSIDRVGGDTGFTTLEPMVRFFWEPDTDLEQRFEFRFGYTSFEADETYVGLTEEDRAHDPFRRYVSTQFDNIQSDQFRYSLSHVVQPSDSLRIETTGYHTRFDRDWYKLQDIRDTSGRNINPATALAAPGEGLDILRGEAAGSWRIRSNDREYQTTGLQSRVDWGFETGTVEHALSVGARLHYDEATRLQRDDRVTLDTTGDIDRIDRGATGSGGNRREEVLAWSMFIEDSLQLGRLTVKPGLRWEHLELEYGDRDTTGANPNRVLASESAAMDVLAPGIGLVYEMNETWSLFGGYYRGISTPAPREYINGGADVEKSDGYEFGVRHYGESLQAELVGFLTDFDSLIVRDSLGGAGGLEDGNAGSAEVYGLELAARWDPLAPAKSNWRLPLRGAATLSHSEITSDTPSSDAESIFSNGQSGNQLPYVPEFTASAGLGLEYQRFGFYLDATYTSEMFGTASNTSSLRDANGKPDARYGTTDEALTLDMSLNYQATPNIRMIAGISNLTGEEYVVSRLPYGARINPPRSYFAGVEIRF